MEDLEVPSWRIRHYVSCRLMRIGELIQFSPKSKGEVTHEVYFQTGIPTGLENGRPFPFTSSL